jgi:hypothetical protein
MDTNFITNVLFIIFYLLKYAFKSLGRDALKCSLFPFYVRDTSHKSIEVPD